MVSVALLFLGSQSKPVVPKYDHDLLKWQEAAVPPQKPQADRMIWFYSADYSPYYWKVFSENGSARACLRSDSIPHEPKPPSFLTKKFRDMGGIAFHRVNDGWIVGENNGEFGANLFWFNSHGTKSYLISHDQINQFFTSKGQLYAVEGLAHLSLSRGSVIKISKVGSHYTSKTEVTLDQSAEAVTVAHDGTWYIVRRDGFVSVSPQRKVTPILSDDFAVGLAGGSVTLSKNEKKAYIGLIQYVAEVDLTSKKVRMLIPSEKFINKLPQKEVEGLRRQYGG